MAGIGQVNRSLQVVISGQNKLSPMMGSIGTGLAGVGIAFTAMAGMAAIAGKESVTAFAEMEQAAANAAAIMQGDFRPNLQGIIDQSIRFGAQTKFTAGEVATAYYSMASAGFDLSDSTNILEGVLNLAAATQSDLAMTSDLMVISMRAFSLETSQSTHVADIYTSAISGSMLTMEKLSTAMRFAAPAAAALNISLEDTTVMLMSFADMGLRGSMMGTTFRMGLTQLTKAVTGLSGATKTGSEVLRDMGLTMSDLMTAEGGLVPMRQVIEKLHGRLTTFGDAVVLFGVRSAGPMLKLIKGGTEAFDAQRAKIQEVGAAMRVAEDQLSVFRGSTTLLTSATNSLKLTLGAALAKGFQPLIDSLKTGVDDMIKWNKETKLFEQIGGLIGGVIENNIIPALKDFLNMLMSPTFANFIKSQIIGWTFVFEHIQVGFENLGKIAAWWVDNWKSFGNMVVTIAKNIGENVGIAFYNMWITVRDNWLKKSAGMISSWASAFLSGVSNLASGMLGILSSAIEKIPDPIAKFFGLTKISAWADKASVGLKGLADAFIENATSAENLDKESKQAFKDIMEGVQGTIGAMDDLELSSARSLDELIEDLEYGGDEMDRLNSHIAALPSKKTTEIQIKKPPLEEIEKIFDKLIKQVEERLEVQAALGIRVPKADEWDALSKKIQALVKAAKFGIDVPFFKELTEANKINILKLMTAAGIEIDAGLLKAMKIMKFFPADMPKGMKDQLILLMKDTQAELDKMTLKGPTVKIDTTDIGPMPGPGAYQLNITVEGKDDAIKELVAEVIEKCVIEMTAEGAPA